MESSIGFRIKSLRRAKGMTQDELGLKLGVTKATINKYEAGVIQNLKIPIIEKMGAALEVTPAHLMGWDGSVDLRGVKLGPLSKDEVELLRIFRRVTTRKRFDLMSHAFRLEDEMAEMAMEAEAEQEECAEV